MTGPVPAGPAFFRSNRGMIMSLASSASLDSTHILKQERKSWYRSLWVIAGLVLVVLVSAGATELLNIDRLSDGPDAIATLAGEMVPPDFSSARSWVQPLIDTLAMSVAGTALAVLFSLPLGFLAARNTSPHPVVYHVSRFLLNVLRSVPELIMGIIFVAAVGFGPLPGVLALGFHSVGMVGKFFAEAIEHADHRPIEAAQAAGARPFQIVQYAIFPQVLPQLADVTIYRWEYNFRASTVMGMVGAGGIGLELMSSLRLMQYQEVLALLLTILAMVTLVDAAGAFLRRRLA